MRTRRAARRRSDWGSRCPAAAVRGVVLIAFGLSSVAAQSVPSQSAPSTSRPSDTPAESQEAASG
ncbi:MAG: hypothetical protein AAGG46_05205, partial [Planctomycetota bacterium]